MVMEASPSPQSVGREFVRQYYTLLNKAPAHLHRSAFTLAQRGCIAEIRDGVPIAT